MGVTPIRDHGEDSRCGALQPILSLLAGAERGSELACRFLGFTPRLMRCLSAAHASSFRSPGLLRCVWCDV